jgi:hypothetical protein
MSIKNLSTGLTLSLLLASGVASADYNSALSAYSSGDYKAAFKEMLPLAEQGNIDAQFWIADMYDSGKGVPENDKAAVKWYTKAAEQGYAKAQYRLGSMYYDGEGIPQNYKTAAKWYTKAAGQGIASGQGILGLMYEYGDGVLTDNRRAYMWYNLASYNGSEQGGKSKDDMAKKMTPADISKAQDMSSLCLESNYTDC